MFSFALRLHLIWARALSFLLIMINGFAACGNWSSFDDDAYECSAVLPAIKAYWNSIIYSKIVVLSVRPFQVRGNEEAKIVTERKYVAQVQLPQIK